MFLTILVFLFVLSLLVLAHELGHFLAAKKAGIKVEEFGIGYPPRVWGKKIGETVYSINLLPIGGFVRLYGEELRESERIKERASGRAFWAKSKKARTAVISAGVLANFLLAIVAFAVVYSVLGIPTKTDQVKIVGLVPDSPAVEAGLEEGDQIISFDDESVTSLDQFVGLVEEKGGQPIELVVIREKEELLFSLTPREAPPDNQGPLGVVVSSVEMKQYPFWQMPFRGMIEGFKEAFGWTGLVVGALGKMIFNLVTAGQVPQDIAGPVGILQITGGVARSGFLAVIQFVGILSVNLAVINILPFPALDGGRLMFVLYELVTRRRPKVSFEHWANAIGMALILFLVLLVTINDVGRLLETTNLLSRLRALWPF